MSQHVSFQTPQIYLCQEGSYDVKLRLKIEYNWNSPQGQFSYAYGQPNQMYDPGYQVFRQGLYGQQNYPMPYQGQEIYNQGYHRGNLQQGHVTSLDSVPFQQSFGGLTSNSWYYYQHNGQQNPMASTPNKTVGNNLESSTQSQPQAGCYTGKRKCNIM